MIEQAKGVLAERHHIPPGEAFQRLRSNNMKLREVCRHVMNGELDL